MKKIGVIFLLLVSILLTVAGAQGQTAPTDPPPDPSGQETYIIDGVSSDMPRQEAPVPQPAQGEAQEKPYIVEGAYSDTPPQPSAPAEAIPQPGIMDGQIKDGQYLNSPPGSSAPALPDVQSSLPLNTAAVNLCIPHSPVTINFDDQAAPTLFNSTVALRYEYRASGVLFSGPADKDGGAVLNQGGGFGVSGHSAPNFLAFNSASALSDGGIPRQPEEILFLGEAISVTLKAGSSSGAGQPFNLKAFDQAGAVLASTSITLSNTLQPASLTAPGGIARVEITTPASVFVVDDLTYIPEANPEVIDFDETTQPSVFANATALRDGYKSRGILFNGPAINDGGAILDETGGFGVSGHSAPNFLAFNTASTLMGGGIPKPPETISFTLPVSLVQVYAGSNSSAGETISMTVYDKNNNPLQTAALTLAAKLQPLTLRANDIAYARVTTPAAVFVLDDLIFLRQKEVTIDFDEVTRPSVFANATALRDEYQDCGVRFRGPAPNDGGAVLDQNGAFGVSGFSARNFLAFNTGSVLSDTGIPRPPEEITFLYPASFFQVYAGSNSSAGMPIEMIAYDKNNNPLGSNSLTLAAELKPLSISADGIARVAINSPASVFVLDSLRIVFQAPVADFIGTPTTGTSPVPVTFTNLSTGAFATCSWDFGDGQTSPACSPPPHVYLLGGKYTVKLTVSGLGGENTRTRTDYINLNHGIYLPIVYR